MFKILILDDDQIQHFIYEKLITRVKVPLKTYLFFDGREAIEFLSKNRLLPNIIVTDLLMPFMSGWEFLDELSLIFPLFRKPISVYVVSSSIDKNDQERCKKYPFHITVLQKPLDHNFFSTVSDLH